MDVGYWQMQRQMRGVAAKVGEVEYHRLEEPKESLDHLHFLLERSVETLGRANGETGIARSLRRSHEEDVTMARTNGGSENPVAQASFGYGNGRKARPAVDRAV
jgi:hypothetical protein